MPPDDLAEFESERREQEAALDAGATGWRERFAPGSLGGHQLLDRTRLVSDLLWQAVVSHPACVRDPELYALARRAAALLDDLHRRLDGS
ncbi:MAG TPA: hypothetical protein VF170_09430 [Planctomycetaceae bacterium]